MKTNATILTSCVILALAAAQPASAAPGGGRSKDHTSEKGQTNTNAQFLADSNRGLERAQERMSDQGLAHKEAADKTKPGAKTKKKKPQTVKKP